MPNDDKFTYVICVILALVIHVIGGTITYMGVEHFLGEISGNYALTSYTAVALVFLKRFADNIYRHVE